MNTSIRIFAVSVALLATSRFQQSVNGDTKDTAAVVKSHLKAVGGTDALGKIKSAKRSGQYSAVSSLDGRFKGTVKQVGVVGKKAYQTIVTDAFVFKFRWNGTAGWVEEPTEGDHVMGTGERVFLISAVEISPLVLRPATSLPVHA